MEFPQQFIRATEEYTTLTHFVPAPYLRRSLSVGQAAKGSLLICGLGFYELYLNGQRITKGRLAPYISNPDDILYFDRYEVELTAGENVIGVCLGNGFFNNPGGYIWDFDKAPYRGAPQLALRLEWTDADGEWHVLESDERWRTAPSPIVFDDYRFGEHYDARLETPGWNAPGFDDSGWQPAIPAPRPRGEQRLCMAEPIDVVRELRPVSVQKTADGYLYDFGVNTAGVCRLQVCGVPGRRIDLIYAERLEDGEPDLASIWFPQEQWERDRALVHRDVYICRGGEESYTPTFTYHGFRYVLVTGIPAEQAVPGSLTLLEMHSLVEERGGFSCSDETANQLQQMTRRSDLANLYYFPTDCPQREKNGWTADASLSAEHMLLNLSIENSYREWLYNIVKAQADSGALPGIVPTSGWGFAWGNGPAWDSVLVELPYQLYRYRGDTATAAACAPAIWRYLHYLTTRTDENGLLAIGLGDWCPAGRPSDQYKAPLAFTDTVIAKDISDKAARLFSALGMHPQAAFARTLADGFCAAVREHLVDTDALLAAGNCQTSQAMALYYGIFAPGERSAAFTRLLAMIDEHDGHLDVGVLGARVLFHVLTAFGRSDLAFDMIVRPDFPSYGNWVARGATSLWEDHRKPGDTVNSRNHHFWGDISGWFMQALAGIRYDPRCTGRPQADICPAFIPQLTHAEGFYRSPAGEISSAWRREENGEIVLTVELPEKVSGYIRLESGYVFADGLAFCPAKSGCYRIRAC